MNAIITNMTEAQSVYAVMRTKSAFLPVRGGTIVGDHDVIFAGTDEVITFSHTAYSKAIFGKGALQAALFLAGKEPGMYDMQDVIG